MLGSWSCRGALALALLSSCGSSAAVVSSDGGTDVSAIDAAPPAACGTAGNGALRVTVSLDPAIDQGTAEVWFATRCDTDPSTVQVVAWNNSTAQSLAGLGPGMWQVYASSFEAPGASSPTVTLNGAATAAVTVTLPASAPLLVRYDSSSTVEVDGGLPDDAGIAASWRGVAAITDPLHGTLGWLECFASPGVAGSLDVQLLVRNTCTVTNCPAITVVAAEVRTLHDGTPMDLGTESLTEGGVAIASGQSLMLPSAIALRGVIPSGDYVLQAAIYGTRGPLTTPSGP